MRSTGSPGRSSPAPPDRHVIWARPLSSDSALTLWSRSGLTPEGVGLLRSTAPGYALVTGLDPESREQLADLVDSAWVGGAGDAAIVRYSRLSAEAWSRQLGASPLGLALRRLVSVEQGAPPMPIAGQAWTWGQRTRVMGIVNVTPDSFSDGGQHADARAAIEHGVSLLDAGADLLDVGGESTRPGAAPVGEAEELRRVLPVIEGLREARPHAVLSIDTRKPGVARAALAAGVHLVNDVAGLRDDAMLDVVAASSACACAMHMLGTPETMQQAPRYDDVGGELLDALELALRRAEARGVPRARVFVDPGIGFGKSVEHNLYLLKRAPDFRLLGAPVLFGVSRKAFLGALTGGRPPRERVVASATVAGLLAAQGAADVVRVHDVAETRDALAVADAVRLARGGGAKFSS
jgi:dihydropteroate synthase